MIIDIARFSPNPSDKFIFDANIWLSLHCPVADHNRSSVQVYSEFYKKILISKNVIYISSHIISEFINRYLRIDFELTKNEDESIREYKKDYRASAYYTETMGLISTELQNKILKITKKLHGSLTIEELTKILSQQPAPDFNDALLTEKVRNKEIKIVTHDGDFGRYKGEFDILTCNQRLIRQ